MSGDQIPAAAADPCGCDEDTAWCLQWMQDHGDPSEWKLAAGADEYKQAHDAFMTGAAS